MDLDLIAFAEVAHVHHRRKRAAIVDCKSIEAVSRKGRSKAYPLPAVGDR
jgi:hypothetical protein